ncbi:membrane carboxypeptidase/penicillin-binding protein [Desulfocapsa sulfexigens DSM 10523]|uniref:Membrane carboxypeptidase/penicillin-binding protein n=1 Tax=Desulfocapsa sulfexigens (strain DSM 10523 / SB164P1) TaxID=1167006 RepID=M1N9Q9_DESSD|nr:transglycosylase domain-containing protein [Desulfocapsa sulfexigens]AGF76594.1 membrane carboxypeptidase/penicillin-binding protein [Desulfocapsa sulfexigens DSM 10523]
MLKKIILFFFTLILLVVFAAGGGLYYLIVLEPGDEITVENIQSILGKESPVLYSDGVTPLGVFFDEAHRQYVTWEQIPETFVNALIASEDNRFFEHFGFDAVSITRAAVKNYEAGRVVQGGSTLTQQTAKNLFKRSGRSYEAKLKELLYALRLEYHYSKEQIFEFYCNQFYVRGNGHGLGVAARYYFDKNVEDLTLLESVFIAGSVKRPNYYNPFNRKSEEAKEEVRERIKIRMAYVLKQMLRLGTVSSKEYEEAIATDVLFTEGQVGYALDYVMEMVKDAVATEEVVTALEEQGISNLATAGVRVITTVDKGLQENSLYSLRHELSRLDVRLRGYDRDEVQAELANTKYNGDREVKKGAFLFGHITDIRYNKNVPDGFQATVDFGGDLGVGVIREKGLERTLTALVKWKQNHWSESSRKDLPLLVNQLQSGDRVWVSVSSIDEEGTVLLDLERFPLLQGGALVLQNGMIKAMAGGVENRFFNRAISAKRTMGSAFKPYLFAAALQLGWNTADLLNNSRDVFVFQGQPYFPRPDHEITSKQVSMSWAGVRSENLASVWLLYHLCDRLSADEFKAVAVKADLAPRFKNGKEEPYTLYRTRIRDKNGIVLNREVLQEAAFTEAVRHLETDFIFADLIEEYDVLRSLHYGLHFDRYKKDIDSTLSTALKEQEVKEQLFRKNLLKTNYLSLVLRLQQLQELRRSLHTTDYTSFGLSSFVRSAVLCYDKRVQRYSFVARDSLSVDQVLVDTDRLKEYFAAGSLESEEKFWEDILLDSTMTVKALSLVKMQVEAEFQRLSALPPYSLDVLAGVHDFRVLVGLKYLIEFGKEMGISSKLDPVLSFPLGSNVITLLEAVRMYESLVTGSVSLTGAKVAPDRDLLTVLDRIETAEGEVVYRTRVEKKELIKEEQCLALGSILENTVKFGTGRYAQENARLPLNEAAVQEIPGTAELVIPLLGKTGTANNYTNASFFGYLPAVSTGGTGMVIDGGYTIGVYVGFDDNTSMRRKTTRITGSGGALPTWTDMVNIILREKSYAQKLDPVDLSFYGLTLLHNELGQLNLAVDRENGGHILNPVMEIDEKNRSHPTIMTFGQIYESGRFEPKRYYAPFWGDEKQILETDL